MSIAAVTCRATIVAALFLSVPLRAWDVIPCSTIADTRHERHLEILRHEPPSAGDYVPKLLPRNDAEVIEDFVEQFDRMPRRPVRQRPANVLQRVFQAMLDFMAPFAAHLQSGVAPPDPFDHAFRSRIHDRRFSAEVIRVVNWSGTRCSAGRSGEYQFLIRLFDAESKSEFARAWLEDSGELSAWMPTRLPVASAMTNMDIRSPEAALRRVSGIVDEKLVDPQYVSTWGTLRCDVMLPCIAMRSAKSQMIYIVDATGDVFTIATDAKRYSMRELAALHRVPPIPPGVRGDQRIVSIGGETMTVATIVRQH